MASLNYKTYNDILKDIKKNIVKIPTEIDLVVGIPRSGMIPAYMIGLALSKPVCSIKEFVSGDYKNNLNATVRVKLKTEFKNILIVDDSVNTGNATNKIKQIISDENLDKKFDIKYMAVYYSTGADKFVDYALEFCPQPRIFEWNYMNHSALQNAALDIDGVLCVDPTPEQNDDGEKYIDFILNAKPLYIPQYKVAALVTSRLGKYRKETEEWLQKNGVMYGELYMLENKTAEQRRQERLHSIHKANIYKKLKNSNLFIESEDNQAREIAELSGKLCFCVTNDQLYGAEKQNNFTKHKSKYSFIRFIRRLIAVFIPFRGLRRKIRG